MNTRIAASAAGVVLLVGAAFAAGAAYGPHGHPAQMGTKNSPHRRDFMFQVLEVRTPNQGGQVLNLFYHYRYRAGIIDKDLPDYEDLRKTALDYLTTSDLRDNPYWETLNSNLCQKLVQAYPLDAISCEMQVRSNDNPGKWTEPGDHASIETIGDIEPLAIPGIGDHQQSPPTPPTATPR